MQIVTHCIIYSHCYGSVFINSAPFLLLCVNCKRLSPFYKSGFVLPVVGRHLQACPGCMSAMPTIYSLCTVQHRCLAPVNMFSGFNVDTALITWHLSHGSKGALKSLWACVYVGGRGKKHKARMRLRPHSRWRCDGNAPFANHFHWDPLWLGQLGEGFTLVWCCT